MEKREMPRKKQKTIRVYDNELDYLIKKHGTLQKAIDGLIYNYLKEENFYDKSYKPLKNKK